MANTISEQYVALLHKGGGGGGGTKHGLSVLVARYIGGVCVWGGGQLPLCPPC